MDHNTAEMTQSVDKYLLNELSSDDRNEFEQHMFDCPICADRIRENYTVIENLKEVLQEERATAASRESMRSGWRDLFRPWSLVPSFAALALACVVGYQNFGPGGGDDLARVLPVAAVVSTTALRGPQSAIAVDRKLPAFLLNVPVDYSRPDAFECEFQNASGKKLLTLKSPMETTASFTLPIELPTRLFPPGSYRMVLRPASERDRIITYPFVIEDSK